MTTKAKTTGTAITVKQTKDTVRAFDGDQVVVLAKRCKGGNEDEWPAGWTVTLSVSTTEQVLAIARAGGVR